jgi:predicted DNA-binding ribbon-helix-helix protein
MNSEWIGTKTNINEGMMASASYPADGPFTREGKDIALKTEQEESEPTQVSQKIIGLIARSANGHLISRNVKIAQRRTSVRLEPEMWEALYEIAKLEQTTIHALCTKVHKSCQGKSSFTAALRVFLLEYYRMLHGELIQLLFEQVSMVKHSAKLSQVMSHHSLCRAIEGK